MQNFARNVVEFRNKKINNKVAIRLLSFENFTKKSKHQLGEYL